MATQNAINRRRVILIILFFIGLSLLLILASYGLSKVTTYEFTSWVQVFGTAGTLVLSALLVVFYMKLTDLDAQQVDLTAQQTEIQATQNSILQFEQRPVIVVENYEVGDATEMVDFEVEEDSSSFWSNATGIELTLENRGRGLAENLKLRFTGVVQLDDGFESFESHGIFVTGTGLSEGHVDNRISMMSGRIGSLPPDSSKTFLTTVAAGYSPEPVESPIETLVSIRDGEPQSLSVGEAIGEIGADVSLLLLRVDIVYEYLGAFSGREVLLRVSADPERIDTIEDFFEWGSPISEQEVSIMSEYLDPQSVRD